MAALSPETADTRTEPSVQPLDNVADERWEDEGGAISPDLARRRFVRVPTPRSHHFGEGQTGSTITQDEQDRLAGRP
jgi:hypothetical protein